LRLARVQCRGLGQACSIRSQVIADLPKTHGCYHSACQGEGEPGRIRIKSQGRKSDLRHMGEYMRTSRTLPGERPTRARGNLPSGFAIPSIPPCSRAIGEAINQSR
jgi:hypothetical protein